MIHKCGKWCKQDGKCMDNFPFYFLDNTFIAEDTYPKYCQILPASKGNTCDKYYDHKLTTVTIHNVVNYSPYLIMKYQCHTHMQICNSIKTVKYVCVYILKGEHLMVVKGNVPRCDDEISHYKTR